MKITISLLPSPATVSFQTSSTAGTNQAIYFSAKQDRSCVKTSMKSRLSDGGKPFEYYLVLSYTVRSCEVYNGFPSYIESIR